jgi:hypothetical protein
MRRMSEAASIDGAMTATAIVIVAAAMKPVVVPQPSAAIKIGSGVNSTRRRPKTD